MARTAKAATNIQVFRGSLGKPDVFAMTSGSGCCGTGLDPAYDKLGERTRFDNQLAHTNPLGGNDKFRFPAGNGFSGDKTDILRHINANGIGATISVLAVPTYAFVTGVGVHIEAEEPGLTFDLVTRNGLVLPPNPVLVAAAAGLTGCEIVRTQSVGAYTGFGALGTNLFTDLFGRSGVGQFALEADEIIVRVASMPASGIVNGLFDLTFSVSYEMIHRAER